MPSSACHPLAFARVCTWIHRLENNEYHTAKHYSVPVDTKQLQVVGGLTKHHPIIYRGEYVE